MKLIDIGNIISGKWGKKRKKYGASTHDSLALEVMNSNHQQRCSTCFLSCFVFLHDQGFSKFTI